MPLDDKCRVEKSTAAQAIKRALCLEAGDMVIGGGMCFFMADDPENAPEYFSYYAVLVGLDESTEAPSRGVIKLYGQLAIIVWAEAAERAARQYIEWQKQEQRDNAVLEWKEPVSKLVN